MKVVVDTNVVISAILRDRDPETVVLFVLESPDVEWIGSQKIVEEYLEVLMRPKFDLPLEAIALWKARFSKSVLLIESPEAIDFPHDRRDAKFLDCALASQADFFITGDRDFEGAQLVLDLKIVSVRQFIAVTRK